jgi:hypothetical protein
MTSALSAPSSPSQSAEPPERCECKEDNKTARSEVSAERQHYCNAQQTRQETYEDIISLGGVGYSTDTPGHKERQKRFKPEHQARADRRCEVVDRGLVRNSPSLESQDERVGSDDAQQDQDAEQDDRCCGAQYTEPSRSRQQVRHLRLHPRLPDAPAELQRVDGSLFCPRQRRYRSSLSGIFNELL